MNESLLNSGSSKFYVSEVITSITKSYKKNKYKKKPTNNALSMTHQKYKSLFFHLELELNKLTAALQLK